jgi:phasin family protein
VKIFFRVVDSAIARSRKGTIRLGACARYTENLSLFHPSNRSGGLVQGQFFDLYRVGVRSVVDAINVSLENTERLQKQQLQMVRSALEQNNRSTGELGEANSLQEIMAINSRLVGAQLDRVTEFWTGLWRTAGETQKSMIDSMQSQMDRSTDLAREGYAFAERASEDATELAASQVAAAVGQVREAASQPRRRSA